MNGHGTIASRTELLARTEQVFRESLKRPDLLLRETDTQADIEGWDSLRAMMILRKLETTFGVRIGPQRALGIRSISDMLTAFEEVMAGQ